MPTACGLGSVAAFVASDQDGFSLSTYFKTTFKSIENHLASDEGSDAHEDTRCTFPRDVVIHLQLSFEYV